MSKIRMESAGAPHSKRFVLDGAVVGLALQMSNGWWGIYTPEEKRLNPGKLYSSAQRAKTAFTATLTEEG